MKKTGALLGGVIANRVLAQYEARQGIVETERWMRNELIKPVLTVSHNFLKPVNS